MLTVRAVRRARHHRNRAVMTEGQQRFRSQLDLLATSDGVCACTRSSSRRGADGSALAAAKDSTEDCAHRRAAGDFTSGVLATGVALLRPLIADDVVALSVVAETS